MSGDMVGWVWRIAVNMYFVLDLIVDEFIVDEMWTILIWIQRCYRSIRAMTGLQLETPLRTTQDAAWWWESLSQYLEKSGSSDSFSKTCVVLKKSIPYRRLYRFGHWYNIFRVPINTDIPFRIYHYFIYLIYIYTHIYTNIKWLH